MRKWGKRSEWTAGGGGSGGGGGVGVGERGTPADNDMDMMENDPDEQLARSPRPASQRTSSTGGTSTPMGPASPRAGGASRSSVGRSGSGGGGGFYGARRASSGEDWVRGGQAEEQQRRHLSTIDAPRSPAQIVPKRAGPGRPAGKKTVVGGAGSVTRMVVGRPGRVERGGVSMAGSGRGGTGTGTGGGNSMGEIAAAAQAARRNTRVDTVVLAKCRRKSQTMWPARLCSKREVRMVCRV